MPPKQKKRFSRSSKRKGLRAKTSSSAPTLDHAIELMKKAYFLKTGKAFPAIEYYESLVPGSKQEYFKALNQATHPNSQHEESKSDTITESILETLPLTKIVEAILPEEAAASEKGESKTTERATQANNELITAEEITHAVAYSKDDINSARKTSPPLPQKLSLLLDELMHPEKPFYNFLNFQEKIHFTLATQGPLELITHLNAAHNRLYKNFPSKQVEILERYEVLAAILECECIVYLKQQLSHITHRLLPNGQETTLSRDRLAAFLTTRLDSRFRNIFYDVEEENPLESTIGILLLSKEEQEKLDFFGYAQGVIASEAFKKTQLSNSIQDLISVYLHDQELYSTPAAFIRAVIIPYLLSQSETSSLERLVFYRKSQELGNQFANQHATLPSMGIPGFSPSDPILTLDDDSSEDEFGGPLEEPLPSSAYPKLARQPEQQESKGYEDISRFSIAQSDSSPLVSPTQESLSSHSDGNAFSTPDASLSSGKSHSQPEDKKETVLDEKISGHLNTLSTILHMPKATSSPMTAEKARALLASCLAQFPEHHQTHSQNKLPKLETKLDALREAIEQNEKMGTPLTKEALVQWNNQYTSLNKKLTDRKTTLGQAKGDCFFEEDPLEKAQQTCIKLLDLKGHYPKNVRKKIEQLEKKITASLNIFSQFEHIEAHLETLKELKFKVEGLSPAPTQSAPSSTTSDNQEQKAVPEVAETKDEEQKEDACESITRDLMTLAKHYRWPLQATLTPHVQLEHFIGSFTEELERKVQAFDAQEKRLNSTVQKKCQPPKHKRNGTLQALNTRHATLDQECAQLSAFLSKVRHHLTQLQEMQTQVLESDIQGVKQQIKAQQKKLLAIQKNLQERARTLPTNIEAQAQSLDTPAEVITPLKRISGHLGLVFPPDFPSLTDLKKHYDKTYNHFLKIITLPFSTEALTDLTEAFHNIETYLQNKNELESNLSEKQKQIQHAQAQQLRTLQTIDQIAPLFGTLKDYAEQALKDTGLGEQLVELYWQWEAFNTAFQQQTKDLNHQRALLKDAETARHTQSRSCQERITHLLNVGQKETDQLARKAEPLLKTVSELNKQCGALHTLSHHLKPETVSEKTNQYTPLLEQLQTLLATKRTVMEHDHFITLVTASSSHISSEIKTRLTAMREQFEEITLELKEALHSAQHLIEELNKAVHVTSPTTDKASSKVPVAEEEKAQPQPSASLPQEEVRQQLLSMLKVKPSSTTEEKGEPKPESTFDAKSAFQFFKARHEALLRSQEDPNVVKLKTIEETTPTLLERLCDNL